MGESGQPYRTDRDSAKARDRFSFNYQRTGEEIEESDPVAEFGFESGGLQDCSQALMVEYVKCVVFYTL